VLFLLLIALAAAIYLNQFGLPGFLKEPLVAELRSRGLDLQFDRLRFRWTRGIVADNVVLEQNGGPRLMLDEVEVRLNHRALVGFNLQVDSLVLREGMLAWPLQPDDSPPATLHVDHITSTLRFLPDDRWELEGFRALFADTQLQLSGTISNASALRRWEVRRPERPFDVAALRARLRTMLRWLDPLQFESPPELLLSFRGDAMRPDAFQAELSLSAPSASTPWGTATNVHLTARLQPPSPRQSSQVAGASLRTEGLSWPDGRMGRIELALTSSPRSGSSRQFDSALTGEIHGLETRWGSVGTIALGVGVHACDRAVVADSERERV
jgi:hypothetical protein